MRLLFHHRIRSKDGQFVHMEELIKALRDNSHEVIVVGPAAIDKEEFGADAGLVAVLKRYLPGFAYELLEFSYAFGDFAKLVWSIRKHRPDGLYERYNLYLPSGVWAKRLFKLPMLLEVNAPLYEERSKYGGLSLKWLARWTERATWRGADYVLPVTQVLADRVESAGVSAHQIVVIPNGINLERIKGHPGPELAKSQLDLTGKLVLGFVGFMREWHGLEHIVDLIADSKDRERHLLIVGDGPARETVEARARERQVSDRVTITGIVARNDVARYIAAFDIALQPDVVEYASPLKLFEYVALGRAVVAPGTDNIKEILTDEKNALLFDPEDKSSILNAIERLCDDPGLRTRLGTNAQDLIKEKELLWSANADKIEGLFKRIG